MEGAMSQLDDLLCQRIDRALHSYSFAVHEAELAAIAEEEKPVDLAYAAGRLPSPARPLLYHNLPSWEARVEFFLNTDSYTRGIIYRCLDDEQIRELIVQMPPDEAVWILEDLSERRRRQLLEVLEPKRAARIRELQSHSPNSAARLMTGDFFAFTASVTIGEVAAELRAHPGVQLTAALFVVDREGVLEGIVPARNLIVNPPSMCLREVMLPPAHLVGPDVGREEVVDLFERYKLVALPVVDGKGKLLGAIPADEIPQVVEDLADETMGAMAGTLEDLTAGQSILSRFLSRAPWLFVTLCGGLINAANLCYFESLLDPWMAFALFFVPLITGMSGNVGIQSSTILVRAMAVGLMTLHWRREAILKELAIGAVTGLAFGCICGLAVYALGVLGVDALGSNPLAVGVVVSCGLFGACLMATFLGVFSPLFFARLGVDPAISSGPIVTAFNDVFSMVIYFLTAQAISQLFFA